MNSFTLNQSAERILMQEWHKIAIILYYKHNTLLELVIEWNCTISHSEKAFINITYYDKKDIHLFINAIIIVQICKSISRK